MMVGGTKEDFVHVSYGYGLFTGGLGLHYGAEKLGATAIPVSSGNTKRQVQILQDYGSDILCCTPSYAMYIGETVRDMGIDPTTLPVRAGIFGAEPWTEQMRKEIERLLAIRAFDIYGLSEIAGPGVACECQLQNGLHINEDMFYPEIVDVEHNKVLNEGEQGEMLITTLTKEGMPILRYRTKDITSLTYEPCKCGRTLARMSRVVGRTDDMLIIRGVNVFPSQIESVLMGMDELGKTYEIVVDRVNYMDTIEVRVEVVDASLLTDYSQLEALVAKIRHNLRTVLQLDVKVKLVEPFSIKRAEGKVKRVIDLRK